MVSREVCTKLHTSWFLKSNKNLMRFKTYVQQLKRGIAPSPFDKEIIVRHHEYSIKVFTYREISKFSRNRPSEVVIMEIPVHSCKK